MHFFKTVFLLLLVAALSACTPAYTRQTGDEVAAQVGLRDSVDIKRNNQRMLSRQARICLISEVSDTPAGANLLRTMQAGFNGYFLAVGVESEPMDYLRVVANPPCPATDYVFYVQPIGPAACSQDGTQCSYPSAQYTLTVVSIIDHSLVDRIDVTVKKSFLGGSSAEETQRLQRIFEQLVIALTGAVVQ